MTKDTNPIAELSIKVRYQDGRHFSMYSPKDIKSDGNRKYFGWRVLCLGLKIMFGKSNSWEIRHNHER